ncbi:MAG: hypothetical protein HC859_00695 [Bacteroidia bacterium]|nr:hypothetical protein [Bacteroidia bacterium]
MIRFGNPTMLWSLLSLAVPIAVHLLSHKEGKVIRVGSLRHLEASSTVQFSNIKLNELMLLALRCLLLATAALLLAQPTLTQGSTTENKWTVIDPSLHHDNRVARLTDSLLAQGYEIRWLAEDFPAQRDSNHTKPASNYWQLLQDLEASGPDNIVVIAANNFTSFKGERTRLPGHVKWIQVSPAEVDRKLSVTPLENGNYLLRSGTFTNQSTQLKDEYTSDLSPQQRPHLSGQAKPVKAVVVYDDARRHEQKILTAALLAISSDAFPMAVEAVAEKDYANISADWLFWLTATQPAQAPHTVLYDPTPGRPIIAQRDASCYAITKKLNEEVAIEQQLPMTLAGLMREDPLLDSTIAALDRRVMPDPMAWSTMNAAQAEHADKQHQTSLDDFVIALLIALLFAERIIANRKNL